MPLAFVSIFTSDIALEFRIFVWLSTMINLHNCFFPLFLDVHRSSVCQKLGSKYSSVPVAELKERNDFYADLLRYKLLFY